MNRLRALTLGGAILVALLLGVFAYLLVDSQRQDRKDVEQRFRDVADISAAVTDGIFAASFQGQAAQTATRFPDEKVDPSRLAEYAKLSRLKYAFVLDQQGKVLAKTEGAPAAPGQDNTEKALASGKFAISDVLGRGEDAAIESAIPFPGPSGQRVLVNGTPITTFAEFLTGFLSRVPNFAKADAVMVDSKGVVLGGSKVTTAVGEPLADEDLGRVVVKEETSGDYGDDRRFAADPIIGSELRLVYATDKDRLYDTIPGSRKTVPWILFAAFALACLAGLLLLRRMLVTATQLQRKQLNESHAVEINDNIIQGLALAKYQLELGEKEASASQVADTLREAQRLVSNLLGEAEVQAGQLRRKQAATTEGPQEEKQRT